MNSKPDFLKIYGNEFDAELCEGYWDGHRLDCPDPGGNRHPAYVHGFRNGRDDIECAKGIRKFPSRTAAEIRQSLSYIEAIFRCQP